MQALILNLSSLVCTFFYRINDLMKMWKHRSVKCQKPNVSNHKHNLTLFKFIWPKIVLLFNFRMDIPRFTFSEEAKGELLDFLKTAKEFKSDKYCNFVQHERMKTLFPMDENIKKDFKSYIENASVSKDITQSDDEAEQINDFTSQKASTEIFDQINDILSLSLHNLNHTTNEDITFAIKENLDMQKHLPNNVIISLTNMSNERMETVFSPLVDQLSLEDIQNFWYSIYNSNIDNDHVILCYIKYIFLKKIKHEFSDHVQSIFTSLSQKYAGILENQLVQELLDMDSNTDGHSEESRVLLQYIGNLSNEFKTNLLRNFIFTREKLHTSYIPIIESLLNPQIEYDLLNKLIEHMSNAASDYANDKSYGKLLYNVVILLGRDVSRLEQPLKHILGIHRSIWKTKVQKSVVGWFEDSLSLSFR